jgi:hypothetical protein
MLYAVRGTEAYAPFKGQWADSVVAPPSEGLLVRTIKCCGHTPERLRRKAISHCGREALTNALYLPPRAAYFARSSRRGKRPHSTSVLSVQEVVPIRIFLRVWGMLCVPVILGNIGHASAQTMGLHSVHIESHSHLPYWFKPYPCSLKNISDPSRWPITLAIPGHVLHTPLTERRNPTGRGHAHAYHRLYPL